MFTRKTYALFALLTTCSTYAFAADSGDQPDFTSLSLEQLSNMAVTSVSKKSEKLSEAPAAIYVITREDIRRSGATSIPEALRMVPGIQVARAGSHQWAITSRGFNDQFANKLLVLMDGRTLYTPLFSGVYWDVQDTLMEDIERIEVIRGPGATLWGANAVNGVINIITKSSTDTVGGLAYARAGNQERGAAGGRYGAKVGDNGYVRAYGKHTGHEEERTSLDTGAGDRWSMSQGGFRGDWTANESDKFTLQGDAYDGTRYMNLNLPVLSPPFSFLVNDRESMGGANLLARWTRDLGDGSQFSVQAYYDYVQRYNFVLDEQRHTFDLDAQYNFNLNDRNEVIWGGGYRLVTDNLEGTPYLNFSPEDRSDNLFSAFVQDKITLIPDEVFLTLGSKFEHNAYTGFEYQPSGRLSWLIDDKQTLWGSVSRAVHTPDRSADDVSITNAVLPPSAVIPVPAFVRGVGNRGADSEELIAYELGYRIHPVENLSFDVAAFYNDYDKLFSNDIGTPFAELGPVGPQFVVPFSPGNGVTGRSYGFELSTTWQATKDWQLTANYNILELHLKNSSTAGFNVTGKSPNQQVGLRSYYNLPYNLELDNEIYYMDTLPGIGIQDYVRFDTRLGWKPMDGVEVSLVGQNLLDNQHPEFSPFIYNSPEQIGRSYYGQVTLKF